MKKIFTTIAVLMVGASTAEAHVGLGHTHGIVSGFMHPVGGVDHVLAMIAVGLFAAVLGGRGRWALPLSFVAMMVVGAAFGAAGYNMPFVETGIALSVVVLGAVVALQWKAPLTLAATLVGVFAMFHGVTHVTEMPMNVSGLQYGFGFVAATAALHGAGLAMAFGLSRFAKVGGIVIAALGLGLVAGMI
jgi:urease accessory protein